MDYTFQKEHELKQWTPLIHFQSGQSGATLRTTEVKPKLDRFLCTYPSYFRIGGINDRY